MHEQDGKSNTKLANCGVLRETTTFINLLDRGISFELKDAILVHSAFWQSGSIRIILVSVTASIFHFWLKVASNFLAQVAICHYVMPNPFRQIPRLLQSRRNFPSPLKGGTHEGTCCSDMSRERISCAVHTKGHAAGIGLLKCSHGGSCRRDISWFRFLIGLFFWSVAGTCCMNSSHEATLRVTGV